MFTCATTIIVGLYSAKFNEKTIATKVALRIAMLSVFFIPALRLLSIFHLFHICMYVEAAMTKGGTTLLEGVPSAQRL